MLTNVQIGNYQKSCLKMVREFPNISEMLRKNKYAVPSSPRTIDVGYWKDDNIENIARELKCIYYYSCIFDNNINIYVPDDYYNYWGSESIKIMFCPDDQKGYLCWYDKQARKYHKQYFSDIDDLYHQITIIQDCE